MKLSLLSLPLLALSVTAGYYNPQPIEEATPAQEPAPASTQTPPADKGGFLSKLSLEGLLTSGPVASILAKGGINITERLEDAKRKVAETGWDPRIDLITDQNYRETIVEEPLSLEEVEQRVWFLLISIPNGDPVSKFVDEKFEAAYNLSTSTPEKALPNVRWGRVNYLDVTELTTRWWVWKAPMLLVLRKNGQELRFYSPQSVRMDPEAIYNFLASDGWKQTPVWNGMLAPGGVLEPTVGFIGRVFASLYIYLQTVPRWIMLMATGALGSLLINLMHRTPPQHPSALRKATPSGSGNGNGTKHARIAPDAKAHDGQTAVRHSTRSLSPAKERLTAERSPSPSKRVSARLQAQGKKQ